MAMKTAILAALILAATTSCGASHAAQRGEAGDAVVEAQHVPRQTRIDHTGKSHRGKASYYGRKFYGKNMANGKALNPNADVAASKTLPLGTKAKVKNLKTGKSTVVDVEDRGPYVKGRSIDLSPKAAKRIDMDKQGVAPVEISPIQVPQPDGSVRPGAAAGGK